MSNIAKFEPRCPICVHADRSKIETMLVSGFSYSEIEREFQGQDPAPRRSISNHSKHHMNYDQTAIRNILDKEAEERGVNLVNATQKIVTYKAYLRLAIDKGFQDLANDNIDLHPREVLRAIELINKLDNEGSQWALEKFQNQYFIVVQAINEVAPQELKDAIIQRVRELENTEEIKDAEVVDADSSYGGGIAELESSDDPSLREESDLSGPMDDNGPA